jgi:uncharacterized protein YjiS (DUF1127 family)
MTETRIDCSEARSQASLPWLSSFVASILSSVRRVLAARRNRRVLEALPDSLLKDIGISRGNIDYIATRGEEGLKRARITLRPDSQSAIR